MNEANSSELGDYVVRVISHLAKKKSYWFERMMAATRWVTLSYFVVRSLQEATDINLQEPFIAEDVIAQKWTKAWVLE